MYDENVEYWFIGVGLEDPMIYDLPRPTSGAFTVGIDMLSSQTVSSVYIQHPTIATTDVEQGGYGSN